MSLTPQEWYKLAQDLHELITTEIKAASTETLPDRYPKLVVMYEFFRLLRGEDFHLSRPSGISEFQQEIYRMEDDITAKLKTLEAQLDPEDSKTQFNLESMKKSWSLAYFNQQHTTPTAE